MEICQDWDKRKGLNDKLNLEEMSSLEQTMLVLPCPKSSKIKA